MSQRKSVPRKRVLPFVDVRGRSRGRVMGIYPMLAPFPAGNGVNRYAEKFRLCAPFWPRLQEPLRITRFVLVVSQLSDSGLFNGQVIK